MKLETKPPIVIDITFIYILLNDLLWIFKIAKTKSIVASWFFRGTTKLLKE
jgi:hypothetical protein